MAGRSSTTAAHAESGNELADNNDDEKALLEQNIADLEALWKNSDGDFFQNRSELQKTIDRRNPVEWTGVLDKYGQGIDIQSQILRTDVGIHVGYLNLDGPRLSLIKQETGRKAKDDIEEVSIYLAQSMSRQNQKKRLSRAISYDQVQAGISYVEKTAKEPVEPEDDYYTDNGVDIKDSTAMLKARQEFYQSQEQHCFQMYHVPYQQVMHMPLDDPGLIVRQYQVSFTEARKLKSSEEFGSKPFGLDRNGDVIFGETSTPEGEGTYNFNANGKKFDVIIREVRNEEGDWERTEWIKAAGAPFVKAEMFTKTEVPFEDHSSFFIIPSGLEDPTQNLPHLRFVPMIADEADIVSELNYINTLLVRMARARLSDRLFYAPASELRADQIQALEGAGLIGEGAGAARGAFFEALETNDSNKIPILPTKLEAWPFPEQEELAARLTRLYQDLERARPNRIIIGQQLSQSEQPTATGIIDQHQAAELPYRPHLDMQEAFWEEQANCELATMLNWEVEGKPGYGYAHVSTGEEPTADVSPTPGKDIYLDGTKISRKFTVKVRISNETRADQMQKKLDAYQDRGQGTLTDEQVLERIGFENPAQQLEELERDRQRKMAQEVYAPLERHNMKLLASAELGQDVLGIEQMAMQQQDMSNQPRGPKPNQPAGNQIPLAGQVPGVPVNPAPVAGLTSPGNPASPV